MKSTEIEIGRRYWVKPRADIIACKAVVLKVANKEPRWFQCISDDGEGYVVFADAIIRPVVTCPQGNDVGRAAWINDSFKPVIAT
jgi:hypothetical protein